MKSRLCKICKENVIQLNFSIEQKYYLFKAIKQDMKLFAESRICSDFKLTIPESKTIVKHLNTPFGKCSNCKYDKLENECVDCPNCSQFNYNLSDPYVSKEMSNHPDWCSTFCSHLEWSLHFEELNDENVNYFWCDGIVEFDTNEIISKQVVYTKAWIGEDGQDIYEMKLVFGTKSISSFKNGESLVECIPKQNINEWIFISPESKKITVILE